MDVHEEPRVRPVITDARAEHTAVAVAEQPSPQAVDRRHSTSRSTVARRGKSLAPRNPGAIVRSVGLLSVRDVTRGRSLRHARSSLVFLVRVRLSRCREQPSTRRRTSQCCGTPPSYGTPESVSSGYGPRAAITRYSSQDCRRASPQSRVSSARMSARISLRVRSALGL